MEPVVYFVVVIDADPNRSHFGADDDYVMEKYTITLDLIKKYVNGKGAICVHTSPRYRERFFRSPFIEFWETWVREGGELILHPEEDTYPRSETLPKSGRTYYNDTEHMEAIIKDKVSYMRQKKLPFAAFRGAFFGLTDDIVTVMKEVGLKIDLSCASGIVRLERAADWANAPASGYYMSKDSYRQSSDGPTKDEIFEIPLGWDEKDIDISKNYLFHERSTYKRMCKVWDAIVDRSRKTRNPQFVNFLCHTYSMRNTKLREQCERILVYIRDHKGIPATASELKNIYNEIFLSS